MARRKKPDDEPAENQDNLNNNSDDTFGLPEVEYEPLKRDEPQPPAEVPSEPVVEEPVANDVVEEPVYEKPYDQPEETSRPYHEETPQQELHHDYSHSYTYEQESPVWPKILAIALLVVLGIGAIYYFAVYQPRQKEIAAEDAERAAASRRAAQQKQRAEAEAKAKAEAEQRRADSLANVPVEGSLELLSGRTGQYYIVIASALDDDLLTDHANKLVKEGKSVKIIPPFGKTGRFYRLAIDSRDNYTDAQAAADGMKGGDFGDQLWVVRY